MNLKLDYKTIIIAVLLVAVVLSLVLRPSKPIEKYETEINLLKQENTNLLENNKTLTYKYDSISGVILDIKKEIVKSEGKLDSAKKVINKLKKNRLSIPAHVDTLKNNELIREYDDYFKRRNE